MARQGVDKVVTDHLSPGMRVLVRGQEWIVSQVDTNSLGNQAVTCIGVSSLVRDYQATFLDDLDSIEPVDPTRTVFVPDDSPRAARSHLFVESMLRDTAPTNSGIYVGEKAAMDVLPYQFVPAEQALSQPRARILIADAVGLGKTLEAGILMSELIRRHKGRRILVVTAKSMMLQFQKEMWKRFTIPLVSLDSSRIQQVRDEIPVNANPFSYYDKVIVSIDTLKRDVQYGAALDASYWDIIVIDEAQNVADRGHGVKRAQRSRLAQRLASRSDTLIMLSATPHDGSAKSFASLMNMLDPTTLPDPDNYAPEDVRQLYVRRFKKDVISDVSGRFPEPVVTQERCVASQKEEAAFDCLTQMHLMMDSHRRNNDALFKTLLEKSLFSSQAACSKTIDERVRRLKTKGDPKLGMDIDALLTLKGLLTDITSKDFSRYTHLVEMLKSDSYGWNPNDGSDRIVIFTERIETKNYLVEHLRQDLGLPKDSIASMDGAMTDIEQQSIVEQFGDEASPIRVLVASDVASEGLNLHYLSHRLIHFDTPWSLMVFQQRNGRIDRYGQRHQPDIRFLTTISHNEKIKGDTRILEILQEKERQARDNIGDPALLMGKFNVEEEEAVTRHAIENGENAEDFAARLTIEPQDIDVRSGAVDPNAQIMKLFGLTGDDTSSAGIGQQTSSNDQNLNGSDNVSDFSIQPQESTLMSDYMYLKEALNLPDFRESMGMADVKEIPGSSGFTVTFKKGEDGLLEDWLRRHVPSPEVLRDDVTEWSTDADYCRQQSDSINAQLEDERWSRTQYLWELNPIMQWIGLRSSSLLYKRGQAPIVGVTSASVDKNEVIILISGMITNRHVSPIVDGWFGVRYRDGEFIDLLTLKDVWALTGYKGKAIEGTSAYSYINREDAIPDSAKISNVQMLLPDAIKRVRQELSQERIRKDAGANKSIEEQLSRIEEWRKARLKVLANKSGAISKSDHEQQARQLDKIYNDYTTWVNDSLTPSGDPVIRVAAAFAGVGE